MYRRDRESRWRYRKQGKTKRIRKEGGCREEVEKDREIKRKG